MGKLKMLIAALGTVFATMSPTNSVALLKTEHDACTAFCINQVKGIFVTALHCGEAISTDVSVVKKSDEKVDLMLLQSKALHPPELEIAPKLPREGDAVRLIGFPMGLPTAFTFFGHVSVREITTQDGDRIAFHEGGGPGMSGAPILDSKGDVISVVLEGTQFPSVVIFGARTDVLREFTDGFRSK